MSVSIGSSRGAPPSEVHDEHLHRKFTRSASASIRGSQWASPSKVHDECLHRKFTRSAYIGEGFDQTPHKSVSFGSTTKTFQAEKTQGFDRKTTQGFDQRYWLGPPSKGFNHKSRSKARLDSLHRRSSLGLDLGVFGTDCFNQWCFHRRGFNRGSLSKGFQPMVSFGWVSTEGLHRRGSDQGSPSEGFRPRVSSEGFQSRVFIRRVLTEGLHRRGSNRCVSIGGDPTEGLH
nr:hypothetical protein [Tanacetum cinerariifolium]